MRYGIAVAVVTVLVAVVVSGILFARQGAGLDKESQMYVDTAITAIFSTTGTVELTRRANPELLGVLNPTKLNQISKMWGKLGALKNYRGAKGSATISMTSAEGKVISAAYVAKADFAGGPAVIKMDIVKLGGVWQIKHLYVDSPAFRGHQ